MFNFDLTKIPNSKLFSSLIILFSLIIPGFSYVYLENNNLFLTLDISKIILLSIFLSLPVIVINITGEFILICKGVEKNIETSIYGALFSSLFSTYAAIILYFLYKYLNTNLNFLVFLYTINIITILISTISRHRNNKLNRIINSITSNNQ